MTAKKTAKKTAKSEEEKEPKVSKETARVLKKYERPAKAHIPSEAQKIKVQATRLKRLARKVPAVATLVKERDDLLKENSALKTALEEQGTPDPAEPKTEPPEKK